MIVRCNTGVEIGFAPRQVEGLERASIADLKAVEVDALGLGIRFPGLDADLCVPAVLDGVPGSRRWMAALLGAAGGRVRSASKALAAQANGERGGRPRKAAG